MAKSNETVKSPDPAKNIICEPKNGRQARDEGYPWNLVRGTLMQVGRRRSAKTTIVRDFHGGSRVEI